MTEINNSYRSTEKIKPIDIKSELKKLLKDILPKENSAWYESSRPNIWNINPDTCSWYVRKVLYNQIWSLKWLVWKNKFQLIWDASRLFKKKKDILSYNIDSYLLENVKSDWIYDIVIEEYKIKENRHSFHRIFVISKDWKMYTIDPFYDSNNSYNPDLNDTEILELDKWKEYFFKKNKKNAEFKILAKYDLDKLKTK